ncbi:unnamed protein product [Nesidiocoris tenuis]|uniref:Uncharacterized protein n=1 Tax=Nesidiocoris tenuis TaxID=355587 RepID=A0A6H5HMF7_9HEMI|nr:unnamed protein product [Nesidiocoris tenuis]
MFYFPRSFCRNMLLLEHPVGMTPIFLPETFTDSTFSERTNTTFAESCWMFNCRKRADASNSSRTSGREKIPLPAVVWERSPSNHLLRVAPSRTAQETGAISAVPNRPIILEKELKQWASSILSKEKYRKPLTYRSGQAGLGRAVPQICAETQDMFHQDRNAMFALTSCPCSWNPTLRTIVILVDHNRRNQNEYEHVASELITRLWKRVASATTC